MSFRIKVRLEQSSEVHTYIFARDRLCTKARFFAMAFGGPFSEATTGTITFNDVLPKDFDSFAHWITTDHLLPLSLEDMIRLYVLADRFDSRPLRNLITNSLTISASSLRLLYHLSRCFLTLWRTFLHRCHYTNCLTTPSPNLLTATHRYSVASLQSLPHVLRTFWPSLTVCATSATIMTKTQLLLLAIISLISRVITIPDVTTKQLTALDGGARGLQSLLKPQSRHLCGADTAMVLRHMLCSL